MIDTHVRFRGMETDERSSKDTQRGQCQDAFDHHANKTPHHKEASSFSIVRWIRARMEATMSWAHTEDGRRDSSKKKAVLLMYTHPQKRDLQATY